MKLFVAGLVLYGIWMVLSELWRRYKIRKLVEYAKLTGKWHANWDDRGFQTWLNNSQPST